MPPKKVITRFAPSPTGHLHIGGIRTALFSYLYARKHQGTFLLRIEDTDKERSEKQFEDSILESLAWLGLSYDGLYRQSEHLKTYSEHLHILIDEGKAYISKETLKEPGDRDSVIRFRNPKKVVTFTDKILGPIEIDTTDLGDFIIAKDFETPIFHFANVIDDHYMNVTLVMRGQEHAPNTPRQILIWEAFGWPLPEYAHIPLILAPDKTKLSKRHGAADTRDYKTLGYVPEAIINFMALIGWNPGTEEELFSLAKLVEAFDLDRVQKSPGVFNVEKLNWMNKEYIKRLKPEVLTQYILDFLPPAFKESVYYSEDKVRKLAPLIAERIDKFSDVTSMFDREELLFFFTDPKIEREKFLWKKESDFSIILKHIKAVTLILQALPEEFFIFSKIKEAVMAYADIQEKRGEVLHPFRYALSGLEQSPDPFTIAEFLGKKDTLLRLAEAESLLAA